MNKVGDLILRAALLKECEERQKSDPLEDGRGWADHFLNDAQRLSTEWNSVEEMIEYAPAVDAVLVKHGHWTRIHIKGKGYGKVYYQHENCAPLLYESPYHCCPECGAMMDEEMVDK